MCNTIYSSAEAESHSVDQICGSRIVSLDNYILHSTISCPSRKKTTEPMLSVEVIKNIRGVLEVNADADFLVVLGIAEKLCPEIYVRLDVDPLVMEEKIVELFDQFAF